MKTTPLWLIGHIPMLSTRAMPLIILYVNGQWLAEAYDSTYTTGDIALSAATLEDIPVEVHFDNILVTSP